MAGGSRMDLIRKLRSSREEEILEVVDALRSRGWLQDGSLRGVRLCHVDFRRADLRNADLRNANLHSAKLALADLRNADLRGANLACADLYGADLASAGLHDAQMMKANLQSAGNLTPGQMAGLRNLWGAVMPDGSLYDGHFELEGDEFIARARLIDPSDQKAMEGFFASAEAQPWAVEEVKIKLENCSTARLIRMLRVRNLEVVDRAIRELRARGLASSGELTWARLSYVQLSGLDLSSFSLHRADLSMAALQGVNLAKADLMGARLFKANLRGANLRGAKLTGANLSQALLHKATGLTRLQLTSVSRLRFAMLPDGSRYDGRYALIGDLTDARFLGVDIRNAEDMADFYGVSVRDYLHRSPHPEHYARLRSEVGTPFEPARVNL